MERWNQIAPLLLPWYDQNHRVLPWRENRDPYRVWVSEIMLQQTRVTAVIPYFLRWMEALPTVAALAAAPEEQVLKLWEGLGYYSRARNLQKAARVITEELGGQFPNTLKGLMALPGIGEYTAGAVASIAFGLPVPAVDGNALRLVARMAALEGDIAQPAVRREMGAMLAQAVPADRSGAFNQAVMDLGATVCLPNGAPLCESCPLSGLCRAHALGRETDFPVKSKKAGRRIEERTVFLLLRQGETALQKRPDKGLLAGLWEFPSLPGTLTEAEAAAALEPWGLSPIQWRQKLTAKHIFTHVEWHMTAYLLDVQGQGGPFVWVDRQGLRQRAVPSVFAAFQPAVEELLKEEPV